MTMRIGPQASGGITFGRRRSGLVIGPIGSAYHPATDALLARMTTQPDATRAGLIDTLIRALVGAGVWSTLDLLYVMAAHTAQAGGLNWTGAGILAPVGSPAPTFTVDRGYQGDGVASYLATDHNPLATPEAFKLSQNSMHVGAMALSAPSLNAGFDIGADNALIGSRARGSGGTAAIVVGNTSTMVTGVAFPQHVIGVRRDAANQIAFQNGAQSITQAVASSGIPSAITILKRFNTFGNRLVMAAHAGSALTDAQVLAFTNALRAYGQGVGAVA